MNMDKMHADAGFSPHKGDVPLHIPQVARQNATLPSSRRPRTISACIALFFFAAYVVLRPLSNRLGSTGLSSTKRLAFNAEGHFQIGIFEDLHFGESTTLTPWQIARADHH